MAAQGIDAEPGSRAFFQAFDALRESEECEPYDFSNRIHGYEASSGLRVLDVGCGNGYVLSRYAMHGAEVFGVDITETALKLTRARFSYLDLPCELKRTDGNELPFESNYFDVVCSMGVLHHIEDPRPMVREIHRVLKPGGKIILMLYYKFSWKACVVLPLKWLIYPEFRGRSFQEVLNANDGKGCPLARVYSRAEAAALLEDFTTPEFELNQLSWKQLFLIPGLGELLKPVLPSCSESLPARLLGWNLYITASKPGS